MDKFVLKLYITGHTPRGHRAVTNLRAICESTLAGRYELTVIDIREQTQLAEDDKVLATPTLIKEQPLPRRRIIGDMSDADRVLAALDINDSPTGGE